MLKLGMIDSHTHLSSKEISQKKEMFIQAFIDAGGETLLDVAYDPESIQEVLETATIYSGKFHGVLMIALGLHPELYYPNTDFSHSFSTYETAKKILDSYESTLRKNIDNVTAIGETGLDYHKILHDETLTSQQREECIEIQKMSFRRHVQLALEFKKPLTIHTRDLQDENLCIEDTLKIVSEEGKGRVKGSFHSYTGDAKYVDDITALGFCIGFNGIITYRGAENVREILRRVPHDRVLTETDAPFLPPQSVRSNKKLEYKMGQPADVKEVIKMIAEVTGKSVEFIDSVTSENFKQILR